MKIQLNSMHLFNKISFIGLLCLSSFLMKSQSPISLSNSNMPGSGDTLRYSTALNSSLGSYTQTGTNFTWNFSSLIPINQGVRSYKNAIQTPYALFFLNFGEYGEKVADTLGAGPLTLTNYYLFYKKQTLPVSAYISDGAGITFSGVPVPNYYSDKDELYHFPMSYPKYDSTTFKFARLGSTLIPIQYSKTGSRVTKVDGWGTVTTPYGTSACLRLITTQYSQDSIKNNLFPFPLGFPNNQRSYQWLTTGSKIPFLEINGNLVGNTYSVTQIRYRDVARTITGIDNKVLDSEQLALYPNPASDVLNLPFVLNESAEVLIYSQEAKLVKRLTLEGKVNEFLAVNVSELCKGIYIIHLKTDTNKTVFKFIKE